VLKSLSADHSERIFMKKLLLSSAIFILSLLFISSAEPQQTTKYQDKTGEAQEKSDQQNDKARDKDKTEKFRRKSIQKDDAHLKYQDKAGKDQGKPDQKDEIPRNKYKIGKEQGKSTKQDDNLLKPQDRTGKDQQDSFQKYNDALYKKWVERYQKKYYPEDDGAINNGKYQDRTTTSEGYRSFWKMLAEKRHHDRKMTGSREGTDTKKNKSESRGIITDYRYKLYE
jgi:hypothetical protein